MGTPHSKLLTLDNTVLVGGGIWFRRFDELQSCLRNGYLPPDEFCGAVFLFLFVPHVQD